MFKIKNFKNKIVLGAIISLLCATPVFADAASGVTEIIDLGLSALGLIPSLFCGFFLFNAFVARGEAKMDGGNAQAQGKMVTNIIEAVFMGAFAAAYYTKLMPLLKQMMNIG